MRCVRLSSKDGNVLWHEGFKASGVDAFVWEMAVFFALLLGPDAGGLPEDVPESAAEDVAFVGRHLERFLDSVGEAVAREVEVFEHGG